MMKFYLCFTWQSLWTLKLLYRVLVPMRKCHGFWCCFRHCLSYSFRICKKDSNILKVFLSQGFCPLKPEITDFFLDFLLYKKSRRSTFSQIVSARVFIFISFFFPISVSASSLVLFTLYFCFNYWNILSV